MKALLYTSDPYEPSGVIGLFENDEQKQNILRQHKEEWNRTELPQYQKENCFYSQFPLEERLLLAAEDYLRTLNNLEEIDIPIGQYGNYF